MGGGGGGGERDSATKATDWFKTANFFQMLSKNG